MDHSGQLKDSKLYWHVSNTWNIELHLLDSLATNRIYLNSLFNLSLNPHVFDIDHATMDYLGTRTRTKHHQSGQLSVIAHCSTPRSTGSFKRLKGIVCARVRVAQVWRLRQSVISDRPGLTVGPPSHNWPVRFTYVHSARFQGGKARMGL